MNPHPVSLADELRKLVERWMKIFHEMSNAHFGGEGERHGNVYRVCADELSALLDQHAVAEPQQAEKGAKKT